MAPAAVAPFTALRVPPAPDAMATAPGAVFETVPTAPETVFETGSIAPDAVFETGSVAPEAVFETVSTGFGTVFEAVFETGSVTPDAVFVTVSTGSDVVLVTAVTTEVTAVVTGAGSIGTSSANACDGAHPRDRRTTVVHMIEKRCAPIDPFAMTRLPDGRPCPHGSHTPAHSFLTRKS
jgi:hypothetical protein